MVEEERAQFTVIEQVMFLKWCRGGSSMSIQIGEYKVDSFTQKLSRKLKGVILSEEQKQAYEDFYSWVDKQPLYVQKGLKWNPEDNVVAVRERQEFSKSGKLELIKAWFFGKNIVLNDGDIYYAKKGAGETPSTNENFIQSRAQWANPTSQNTPAKTDTWDQFDNPNGAGIAASIKTISSTYPKTNDTGDADNTGDAIDAVSYKHEWTTADFNDGGTTIKNGALHDNASPVNGSKLLTHFSITAFNKTASDTLKLYTNHTFNGV